MKKVCSATWISDASVSCHVNQKDMFLAVPLRREGQLYRWPRHSLTDYYTVLKYTAMEHSKRLVTIEKCYQSDEETWPDQKKTKTKTKTKTMTKTNTFREHLQWAILETCDLWDIWSEWWGDMTRPKKRQWQRQRQRQIQRQRHLENTFKERS